MNADAASYRVEIILFEHKNTAALYDESWHNAEPPDMSAAIAPPRGEPVQGFQRLAEESLRLADIKTGLQQSGRYRIIRHLAWQQPGLDEATARPVFISAGKDFSTLYPERMQSSWSYDAQGNAIEVPAPRHLRQVDGTIKIVLRRFLHVYTDLVARRPVTGGDQNALFDFAVKAHRRVRSGELHYLDHPMLGILIRIDPV